MGILDPKWPSTIRPPANGGSALLHATDVRYLNDSAEVRFGADLMIDRLNADISARNDQFTEAFEQLREQLQPGLFDQATRHLRAFTTCFCANGDLLSQWRGYGGGVGGFAIGFPVEVLLNRAIAVKAYPIEPLTQQVPVMPVIYGEAAAAGAIDRHLADLRDGRGLVVISARNQKPGVEWLLGEAYRLLARLKHDAFEEEQEWRLVVLSEPGSQEVIPVRQRGAGLAPYVPIAVNVPEGEGRDRSPQTISKIVVGPGADQQGQAWAVADFLTSAGYPQTEIVPSRAPYRG